MIEQHEIIPARQEDFAWASWSAVDISTETQKVVQSVAVNFDAIKAVPAEQRNTENTLWAYDKAFSVLTTHSMILDLLLNVSPEKLVRAAASAAKEQIDAIIVDYAYDQALYKAIQNYAAKGETLSADAKRFLHETIREFRRKGFDLPEETREKVQAQTKRLQELYSEFFKNLNNAEGSMVVTPEETAGLSVSYLANLTKDEQGNYIVTTAYPDYISFMQSAHSDAKRKELTDKYYRKGGDENIAILQEARRIRMERARLLGYANQVAYETEIKMAKSDQIVREFLDNLIQGLRPLQQQEKAELLAFKRERTGDATTELHYWDVGFLQTELQKKKFNIDPETIKEYFPLQHVLEEMFRIYSEIFSVSFVKVDGYPTFIPYIQVYAMHNKNGELLAYFTLDLYPRDAKYGHAAQFPIIQSHRVQYAGSRQYSAPVTSMVTNFPKTIPENPSLMPHSQVETLFHEFGHVIHFCLAQTPYCAQSGITVAQDFGEAPSQILEYWVWEPEILKRISKHYKTGEPMSDELISRLVASKKFGAGWANMRQMMLSLLDHRLYTEAEAHPVSLYKDLVADLLGMDVPENQIQPAGFLHLMNPGYEGGYYGYMWSRVYAADMFSRFKAEGILNPQVGLQYRQKVLEVGSSRDEMESVKDFLGREPNNKAFLEELGLS